MSQNAPARDLLDEVLAPDPPPFCVLYRPHAAAGRGALEIIVGDVVEAERIGDLPLPEGAAPGAVLGAAPGAAPGPASAGGRPEMLVLVPYRQIAERGFACHDDGEPVAGITVRRHGTVGVDEAVRRIGDGPLCLDETGFDIADRDYAEITRQIIAGEIGKGEGSNFVIKRSFKGHIRDYSPRAALTIFRRLLCGETGTYWTFVVHTGTRTLVGASPERHVSLTGGMAVMNPISGTYRYAGSAPRLADLMRFLADRKEADELYMVVDEELKMMARVCDDGGRVVGPRLKEMARLAHTEYLIEGYSSLDVRSVIRETMFAPTVTGSPLENACRVIARHETRGRGYYSGVIGLIGRDGRGRRELDSAILIRTADIDRLGNLDIGVGATLVRHSDPDSEVAETHAKAAGLLTAIGVAPPASGYGHGHGKTAPAAVPPSASPAVPVPGSGAVPAPPPAPVPGPVPASSPGVVPSPGSGAVTTPTTPAHAPAAVISSPGSGAVPGTRLGGHPEVRSALLRRNSRLARFWLTAQESRQAPVPHLLGRSALVVEAEDTFTGMLAHQLRALGLEVTIRPWHAVDGFADHDLAVLGPGPGDPGDRSDPRLAELRRITRRLLAGDLPFLAVCLGHQMLASELGLRITRLPAPNQGAQKEIDLFGERRRVGFYNTYAARHDSDAHTHPAVSAPIEVARDPATGEVYGLRCVRFASLQFHPESLLTEHGITIVGSLLTSLVGDTLQMTSPAK